MVIIGILAAIAIPVFLAQRQNANQAACRSDVRNGAAAATAYAANNNGSYVGMTAGILQAAPYGWNLSAQSNTPTITDTGGAGVPGANSYRITVQCTGATAAAYNFDTATGTVNP